MDQVRVYGLKNCDSCKKAMQALGEAGMEPRLIDIRSEADLQSKLPEWIREVDVDSLINRRSTTWRSLADEEKRDPGHYEDGNATQLLAQHPTLIKRPVIEYQGRVLVGWNKATQAALNS